MFRSIVIGLGSMCLLALVVLGIQNWDQMPKPNFPKISIPSFALYSNEETVDQDRAEKLFLEKISPLIKFSIDDMKQNYATKKELKVLQSKVVDGSIIPHSSQLAALSETQEELETEVRSLRTALSQVVIEPNATALELRVSTLETENQKLRAKLRSLEESRSNLSPGLFVSATGLRMTQAELNKRFSQDIKNVAKRLDRVVESVESESADIDGKLDVAGGITTTITLDVGVIGSFLGMQLLEDPNGLWVIKIDENSSAYAAGLRQTNLIIEVERMKVRTFSDFSDVVRKSRGNNETVIFVKFLSGEMMRSVYVLL